MNFNMLKLFIETSHSEQMESLKKILLRYTCKGDKNIRTLAMVDFNKIWKYQEKIQINEPNDIVNHIANFYKLALSIKVTIIVENIMDYIDAIQDKCKTCCDLSPEFFGGLKKISDDFQTQKLRNFLVISSENNSSTQSIELFSDEEFSNEDPYKKNTIC